MLLICTVIIVICFSISWFIGRLAAWLAVWMARYFMGLDIKIKGIGFLTLADVDVRLGPDLHVGIEKIWLTSCYINRQVTKPLSLCISDIRCDSQLSSLINRIQTRDTSWQAAHDVDASSSTSDTSLDDTPLLDNTSRPDVGTRKFSFQRTCLNLCVAVFQYCSVHIENMHMILLKDASHASMLHVGVLQLHTHFTLKKSRIHSVLRVESFTSRVLKSSAADEVQEGTEAVCLAEFSFSQQLKMIMPVDPPHIEELDLIVRRPHIMLTEAILSEVFSMTSGMRSQRAAGSGSSSRISRLISSEKLLAKLHVEDAQVCLCKTSVQRTLCVSAKSLDTTVQHTGGSVNESRFQFLIKDVSAESPHVHLASLSLLDIAAKTDDHTVDVASQLQSCTIGYHHEELLYWLGLFPPHISSRNEAPLTPSQPRQRSPVSDWLMRHRSKKLSVTVNAQHVTTVAATATCSGVNAGFTNSKLSLCMKPEPSGAAVELLRRDVHIDFELIGVYCCLSESRLAARDLSPRQHHWNTLLYLDMLIVNINQLTSQVAVEAVVESLQVELSTTGLAVVGKLVSALKSDLRPRRGRVQPAGTGEGETDRVERAVPMQLQLKCNSLNVFACTDTGVYNMLRIDCVSCQHRPVDTTVDITGTHVTYAQLAGKVVALLKSQDLPHDIAHLNTVRVTHKPSEKKVVVRLEELVHLSWTHAFHLCLCHVSQDVVAFKRSLTGPASTAPVKKARDWPSVSVTMDADLKLSAQLSKHHRVAIQTDTVTMEADDKHVCVECPLLGIVADQHKVFTLQGLSLEHRKHCPDLVIERSAPGTLTSSTNRVWIFTSETLHVVFPHAYKFADCLEELKNLIKWMKLVHKIEKKPFTQDSALPPDLCISIQNVLLQLSDDPLEVKLGDNYQLMTDEHLENEKRLQAMDKKVQELRRKHGLLSASKLEELYSSLSKMSSEVYIERCKQLYTSSARRTKLYTWTMTQLRIVAMADRSMHGYDSVLKHMRDIDKTSPHPEEGSEFTTLWCRQVSASVGSWTLQLRDYPQPLLEVDAMHIWGRLIGAEQMASKRATRSCEVEIEEPWGNMTVERRMPPLKFYHDLSCDVSVFNMAHGACWEPALAEYNLALNLVNQPSLDPSAPLPFWDKCRLLLHGRLTMSVQTMSWLYHASLDPYNTTEMMDWTWTSLVLDWTTGKWVLKGDLDVYARTASKYDDCRLLHLPDLRFCVRLEWLCLSDPNDHHAVMPCAPDKLPEYSMQEHDSYRAFRSQNVNMSVSFDVKPQEGAGVSSCLFYGSTLRWLDKVKMCLARVSRPIKRGRLFDWTPARKPQFGRHYKLVRLSFNVCRFHVFYWMSYAKQSGAEMDGDSFSLAVGLQLCIQALPDGLLRRPQGCWNVSQLDCDLNHSTVWLCSVDKPDTATNISARGQSNRSVFASVQKVNYRRAEETPQEPNLDSSHAQQDVRARHKVHISCMKAAWTEGNRNVVLTLYDSYTRAKVIRKSLSSVALKAFRVDSMLTPQKGGRVYGASPVVGSSTNTPSPWSRIQSGPALSMLKKLVSESDSNFIAVHEENLTSWLQLAGGGVDVEQLHGIVACQKDDVLFHHWHVEFSNSQVMLRGCETPGYVIVSAAAASIVSCHHKPMWQQQQLKSKTSWVGSVECMQYYATVDAGDSHMTENILWLTRENVEDRTDAVTPMTGMDAMLASGVSVGGVVTDPQATLTQEQGSSIQLQRIISRCTCQFFYVDYGEVEDGMLPEVPLRQRKDADMMKREDAVDSFTLLHHDLNICTNSLQYAMVLDIVNNLLLYVEPKKKELTEKLQNMRFQLQLCSVEDLKTPILQRQNNLRELVLKMRRLERELFMLQRSLDDHPSNAELHGRSEEIETGLFETKEQISSVSEELAIMISCFKESQLQVKSEQSSASHSRSRMDSAPQRRLNEVCFKHAEWRMTEADGQIGIADLVLRNFLYTKTNREDNSGCHQLELGWIKVTNLLPESPYRDLLSLEEPAVKGFSDNKVALRILCKFKAPVGGISVKEHFEVNVMPLNLQLTHRFYKTALAYFFPTKNGSDRDDLPQGDEGFIEHKASRQRRREEKKLQIARQRDTFKSFIDPTDIDIMKERAKNNMFLYIKVTQVPLRVSYKGEKEKNLVTDVNNFHLLLPTLEYHNKTWTWLDMLLGMKGDCKRVLISQAIKQKLHMKSATLCDHGGGTSDVKQEEDKAKLLLGSKLQGGTEKLSSRKSLFGKFSK